MPSIKDLRFDLGDAVRIKPNGRPGKVAGIMLDGQGINYKIAYQIMRPDLIDDFGTYFLPEELEKA